MKSLFDPKTLDEMLSRLRSLSNDSERKWGKMSVAQMLAHCQTPMCLAIGDVKLKRSLLGKLIGRMIKGKVVGPKPFKQGLPTDARFVVKDERDFATEHTALSALVERYAAGGPDGISKDPHPFFGPMTPEEWDALMWKHLDHHLQQFGA